MNNKYDALLVTAGAGMGVDSGLPDFRGVEGFWEAYPIIKNWGYRFEEMANPRWFSENPELAWAFYGHRYNLYKRVKPHQGFGLLKELGERMSLGYHVVTSNVDGQFQKSGYSADVIHEIHGSIHHFQCSVPCTNNIWEASVEDVDIDEDKFLARNIPLCPNCGAVARPNILMFGDWSWLSQREEVQSSNLNSWLNKVASQNGKLLIVEIGAGESVPTIRRLSERYQTLFNADFYRINPKDYQNDFGFSIASGGLEGIKELVSKL